MPPGDNKCAACGQFAGRGHRCPTRHALLTADRPTGLRERVAAFFRRDVADRVQRAHDTLTSGPENGSASLEQRTSVLIARDLTGLSEEDVEAHMRGLYEESSDADLPPVTRADVDTWCAEADRELELGYLMPYQHSNLGHLVQQIRDSDALPDPQTFWMQRNLLARCRQQALVDSIPGIVQLDPPGTHSAQYVYGEDGRPSEVFYASYGSNLFRDRFNIYLEGGMAGKREYSGSRDKTPPAEDIPVALRGTIHYAGNSRVWTGGPAFLDPTAHGKSLGRAYRITSEQFDDVVAQESHLPVGSQTVDLKAAVRDGRVAGTGVYGTLVHVGDHVDSSGRAYPVITFTGDFTTRDAMRGDLVATEQGDIVTAAGRTPEQAAKDWPIFTNPAADAYREMIGNGLAETHGLTPEQASTYFAGSTGNFR